MDAKALGAQWQSQGEMNLVSDMRRARRTALFADGKAVWFWHPLLVSSQWRFYGPDRVRQDRQFAGDGDKTNSSPGRARYKPLKPLRGECRAISGLTVVTMLVCFYHFTHEAAGASGARYSLRPLIFRG